MKEFAQLFYQLDQTTKTTEKLKILVQYFKTASNKDKVWMISLFMGKRPKRIINSTKMREYAAKAANIPLWLMEECYSIAGDLSETISLIIPNDDKRIQQNNSLSYYISFIKDLELKSEEDRETLVIEAWKSMDATERFVFNKITSATFRVGVSQTLVTKALAKYTGEAQPTITHRLMGNWDPSTITFEELINKEATNKDLSHPYPFYLAYGLETAVEELGSINDWQAEWKWDGIRSQIIKREGQFFIWSRGEELITDKFPEIGSLSTKIPDGTVFDGEILGFKDGQVLPFSELQKRVGRKNISAKILSEIPVVVFAYDLLEFEGKDIRELPLSERRQKLESIIESKQLNPTIQVSEIVNCNNWEQLTIKRLESRNHNAEGFMLKNKNSPYLVGRKKGDWWKWKIDPMTIDGVMIYAQAGTGRRANLFTDYTFGVWKDGKLVTFAKAYSGLTDKEIVEIDKWIKKNTIEKFGPVRTVKPELVFEIGFEGIQKSSRHKSGIALRFPRILRWRQDKKMEEADSLETLQGLLNQYGIQQQ